MCKKRRKIFLIGIGMGSRESMTMEATEAIRACDCMIGAQRMLDLARELRYGTASEVRVPELSEYNSDKIFAYIEEHSEYVHVAVLFSGDTGFYSGAKKLSEMFAGYPDRYEVTMIPGISSVICLAARLKTTWEDGAVLSLHGQEENFIQTVNKNRKTFLLLGGKGAGEKMITRLKEYGAFLPG